MFYRNRLAKNFFVRYRCQCNGKLELCWFDDGEKCRNKWNTQDFWFKNLRLKKINKKMPESVDKTRKVWYIIN
jgi:hypothetical protein